MQSTPFSAAKHAHGGGEALQSNGPLTATGTRIIRYSSTHSAEMYDPELLDIDSDAGFVEIFKIAREHSMVSKYAMHELYQAVRYVVARGIEGDFVECGAWRGGSALLAALTFRELEGSASKRRVYLYDTFEGMTQASSLDVDIFGTSATEYMDQYADAGKWCYANMSDVRSLFASHGFSDEQVRFIKGDVCETLRHTIPSTVSILRLDTDWYESTKTELEILYPRLAANGVLILDDYGHWKGARKAVDEYFVRVGAVMLHRVADGSRVAIKTP